MKTFFKLFLFMSLFLPKEAFATSLDEIYRDIVQSDNQGYLPVFVKNRNIPDFLTEDEAPAQDSFAKSASTEEEKQRPVMLINERKIKDQLEDFEKQKWEQTLKAVQENRVTPVDLSLVEEKYKNKDQQATEILAWMYTTGTGVSQNLVKAFTLYQEASALNVPNALENARMVYHSMTPAQKSELDNFKN